MKKLIIPILLLLASQLPAQQPPEPCTPGDCHCIYESAMAVKKAGRYELAVNKLNAWKTCDTERSVEADSLIIEVFREVEGLKEVAESEKAKADSLNRKNEKIINAFYFYADRFALAYGKKDGENVFYFIDKNGDEVTRLGQWDKAEQFEWTGFAKVRKMKGEELKDFLLDTLGNIYPVAYDLKDVNETITALDLSEKKLTAIPAVVFQQVQLNVLLLNRNILENLPESIKELKSLTYLDLSLTQLSSLPESIGELKSLSSLDLGENQFRSLPESIGKLKSLTSLDLYGNQLSSLPQSIGELKSLTSLNLSVNQFSSLPESIGELKNLTSLYLYGNQLSSLPQSIGKLKSLTSLDLSSNLLSSLPKSIKELKSLTSLNLIGNPIPANETQKLKTALPNCEISFE